jgi:KDO2-lipid IV(A) lauroyltransferase
MSLRPHSLVANPFAAVDAATHSATREYRLPWILSLLARLPFCVLCALTQTLALLLRYGLRYRLQVVRSNLRRCFPNLAPAALDKIINRYYSRLGEVAAEVIKLGRLSADELRRRVHFPNLDLLRQETQAGRSVILLAAHLHNWEWQLQGIAVQLGVPIDAAYKPLHGAWADHALLALRSRFGARMVPAKQLPRVMARHRAEVHAIALMADQVPASSDRRYWLRFLGSPTAFYQGPALIARATDYATFFAATRRVARGHYEIHFEPITSAQRRLDPRAFTACYARMLEAQIRADPPSWLWSHRRWKLAPPVAVTSPADSRVLTE